MIDDKITLYLLCINTILLAYLGWNKGACLGCNKLPFLPMPEMFIALTGAIVSIFLAIIVFFSATRKILKYVALVIAGISSVLGTFLLGSQILFQLGICIPCLLATTIFCVVFYILGYQTIITSLLKNPKETI